MNRYRNKWHDTRNQGSKEFYEHSLRPYLQHNGYTVFKLFDKAFDIVFDGVCISQRCGASVELLDRIDSGLDMYTPSPRTSSQKAVA